MREVEDLRSYDSARHAQRKAGDTTHTQEYTHGRDIGRHRGSQKQRWIQWLPDANISAGSRT